MSETLETTSTSAETMAVSPIVLRETKTTRLVFYPIWVEESSNPLRGGFRFQRKGPNDIWDDIEALPLTKLHKNEEYKLNLKGEEIGFLLSELDDIQKILSEYGHVPGKRSINLTEQNAEGIFLQISDVNNKEWIIKQLKQLESSQFETLGSVIGSARLSSVIETVETNLTNADEDFWQKFFENHPWILHQVFAHPVVYLQGETYLGGKNTKGRNGQGGVVTDYLMQSGSNNSFAVVEMKPPTCKLVGSLYRGERDGTGDNIVYAMHGDLTGGIVQMENQIRVAVKYFRSQIIEDYPDLNRLDPAGVLIVGQYSSLNVMQKRSFDLFRKSLGKNSVFTYDDILTKLKLLKEVYE